MSRKCARPGCGHSAVATMSYAYSEGVVWLEELTPQAHPMVHDLCRMHADAVRVPVGWELRDERAVDLVALEGSVGFDQRVGADRELNRSGTGIGFGLVGA